MNIIEIATSGLSKGDLQELRALLKEIEGVSDADYFPDVIGRMQYRSPINSEAPEFIIKIFVTAVVGEVGKSAYRATLERVAKAVETWKARGLSQAEEMPKRITLMGSDQPDSQN